MKTRYKVVKGAIIDSKHNAVIYDPDETIPAKEVAKILNEYSARGLFPDWCEIAHVLVQRGILKDIGLCDDGQTIPED